MCEERRADVQRIEMNGSTPQQKWSVNFTSIQAIAWMVSKLVATIVGLWAGVSFIAGYQFERSLDDFHTIAKPEIRRYVNDAIKVHKVEAEAPIIERLHEIENQAGQYDARLQAIKEAAEKLDSQVDKMDDKLDRILERMATR